MRLNIDTTMINAWATLNINEVLQQANSILDNAVVTKPLLDSRKLATLKSNLNSKRTISSIQKMFYDIFLAGNGLHAPSSSWSTRFK